MFNPSDQLSDISWSITAHMIVMIAVTELYFFLNKKVAQLIADKIEEQFTLKEGDHE